MVFRAQPETSDALIVEISEALEAICDAPLRWPKYVHGTHRFLLRRFPFPIIYLDDPDFVNIVAVAHFKRRPGYWRQRV